MFTGVNLQIKRTKSQEIRIKMKIRKILRSKLRFDAKNTFRTQAPNWNEILFAKANTKDYIRPKLFDDPLFKTSPKSSPIVSFIITVTITEHWTSHEPNANLKIFM